MGVRRALLILLLLTTRARGGQEVIAPAGRLDYRADVQPIFERRCQPCHFPGGKMYAMLPFDDGRTIVKLDTKLFTRIKDERDRAVIRAFLAQTRTK
jgi:hypothetical protein